jgi:hypothetical protein
MQNHSQTAIERFWNERCEISDNAKVPKGEAYAAYCEFARGVETPPLSITEFAKALKMKPCVKEGRTKKARIWLGFKIISKSETSVSKIEAMGSEIVTKREIEVQSTTFVTRVPNPRSTNEALDELLRKNLLGVWEIRKI